MRVPASGGKPEAVTQLDKASGEVGHRLPHVLPDGRPVVYTSLSSITGGTWRIWAQRLGEKQRHLLVEGGSDGRWAPPGVLVWAREGALLAARFDAEKLRLTGEPVSLLVGLRHAVGTAGGSFTETGAMQAAIAKDGLLAYVVGPPDPEVLYRLVSLDAQGKGAPVGLPAGQFVSAQLSGDGGQLLVSYGFPGKQAEVHDLERGSRRQVTFGARPFFAIWDGLDRITFESNHEGSSRLYGRRADAGPGEVETLWAGDGEASPGSWSRDGRTLAFVVCKEPGLHDIWLLPRGGQARPFVTSPFRDVWPEISPDGKWLLYGSDETGYHQWETFVRPLAGEGGSQQVSAGGGLAPRWAKDGTAVYYWQNPARGRMVLFRVGVKEGAGRLTFGRVEQVLEGPYTWWLPGHGWDTAPDGRFLVIKAPDEAGRKAVWDARLSTRIRVDLGGIPALLAEAEGRR